MQKSPDRLGHVQVALLQVLTENQGRPLPRKVIASKVEAITGMPVRGSTVSRSAGLLRRRGYEIKKVTIGTDPEGRKGIVMWK